MKKVLCLALTAVIVLSISAAAYANNGKGGAGGSQGGQESKKTVEAGKTEQAAKESKVQEKKSGVESLRQQLQEQHKNKVARKELIKQIVQERRQNKDNSTMVFVNGKEVAMDVPPVIKGGRTLIPVRAITNAFGAIVEWDKETKTVTITKVETVIKIVLGSTTATVNGTEVTLGAPADLLNNRTIVPIRFIAETFKKNVEWDDDTGSVVIEDGDEDQASDPEAPAEDENTNGTGTDTTEDSSTGTGSGTSDTATGIDTTEGGSTGTSQQ